MIIRKATLKDSESIASNPAHKIVDSISIQVSQGTNIRVDRPVRIFCDYQAVAGRDAVTAEEQGNPVMCVTGWMQNPRNQVIVIAIGIGITYATHIDIVRSQHTSSGWNQSHGSTIQNQEL